MQIYNEREWLGQAEVRRVQLEKEKKMEGIMLHFELVEMLELLRGLLFLRGCLICTEMKGGVPLE